MHTHHLFKPLSAASPSRISSFEVPAENYSSLSVVMLYCAIVSFIYFIIRICTQIFRAISSRIYSLCSFLFRFLSSHRFLHLSSGTLQGPTYSRTVLIISFLIPIFFIIGIFQSFLAAQLFIEFKARVEEPITDGIRHLSNGISHLQASDQLSAMASMRNCTADFNNADNALNTLHPLMYAIFKKMPIVGGKLTNGERVIRAGEDVCVASVEALSAYGTIVGDASPVKQNYSGSVILASQTLKRITPLIHDARTQLHQIDFRYIPASYTEAVTSARGKIEQAAQLADTLNALFSTIADSIGSNSLRRYLLLFQNNAEIRPTGGFIGSIALIDISNGILKHVEIPPGGPYDMRGSFHEHLIPPKPLQVIASEWQFQDANWWADFPSSAKKIIWFYEKAGGPTVDGVIAVNASIMPQLLSLVGPIELRAYEKTFTPETVLPELQKAVEIEYDRAVNKPKQIIADTFPLIVSSLSDQRILSSPHFILLMFNALMRKDIQIYFRKDEYEQLAQQLNIAGNMKKFDGDYSMIVSANIGGGKSDSVLKTDVKHTVILNSDGTLDVELTLRRAHAGVSEDTFTGMPHNDYMRIYAPYGSTLDFANGFFDMPESVYKKPSSPKFMRSDPDTVQSNLQHIEKFSIDQWAEGDKTVFGGWFITKPSSFSTVSVRYRLPITIAQMNHSGDGASYALLIQRQSGSTIASYTVDFKLPSEMRMAWSFGGSFNPIEGLPSQTYYTDAFQGDNYVGFGTVR